MGVVIGAVTNVCLNALTIPVYREIRCRSQYGCSGTGNLHLCKYQSPAYVSDHKAWLAARSKLDCMYSDCVLL